MKTRFNLQAYLHENREQVINKFNELTKERFYDGCTLKTFMVEVMNMMAINVRGQKSADNFLPHAIGYVYVNHSKVYVDRDLDAERKAKMPNEQWAALV